MGRGRGGPDHFIDKGKLRRVTEDRQHFEGAT